MRRETKTWAGRLVAAAVVAFVLAFVPYHLYARSGLAKTLTLSRDLRALRARNHELRAENDRLEREAEALRSDPAAIERVARSDLGWVRPGEIVVDLGAAPAGAGASGGAPR
ncbi:MAG TPA: septum formation initiator family protein [Polyangia bacterium]|nr:septum formation initiator family protein [Polyangia bacterium]